MKNIRLYFDRRINSSSWSQLLWLIGLTAGVFVLAGGIIMAFLGSDNGPGNYVESVEENSHFWQLYYFFADPGNQMSIIRKYGSYRWVGFVMSTLGSIFLGGLLISTITNMIERRVQRVRDGEIYYNLSDHVLVVGNSMMTADVVRQACESDAPYVTVLTDTADMEAFRAGLEQQLEPDARKKLIVYKGSPDSREALAGACVARAREVTILGDDTDGGAHDALNVGTLELVAEVCRDAGRTELLPVNIAFCHPVTLSIYRYADLSETVSRHIDLRPFSFEGYWAERTLVKCENGYKPLDYKPITSPSSPEYVHLIVIGLNALGEAMALQAAHVAHYPNWRSRPTHITIIDPEMERLMPEFISRCGSLFDLSDYETIDGPTGLVEHRVFDRERYRHLFDGKAGAGALLDIEWTFVNGSDALPAVKRLLEDYAADPDAMITVAACQADPHAALQSAMHLPLCYYTAGYPILVNQPLTPSIVDTLSGLNLAPEARESLIYKGLRPFGMTGGCSGLLLDGEAARRARRANAIYAYFYDHNELPEAVDDAEAERLWQALRVTKRWSNIYCVASIPGKLRSSLGHPKEHVEMLAEMEHNRWMVEELLLGYRPVTADEQADIEADTTRKGYHRSRFAHYDIRPYPLLRPDASGHTSARYDRMIVRAIQLIIGN